MARRSLAPLLVVVTATLLAAPLHAGPGSHPYFDDGGTLTWYRSYDEARAAAAASGKVILVDYGRRICGSCKRLCGQVFPDARVRARLSRAAVGLAAECDRPDPRIRAMFARYQPTARMLPLVAFLDAEGTYITGFSGGCDVNTFLGHLARAEARVRVPRPAPAMRAPEPTPRVSAPVAPCPVPAPRSTASDEPCPGGCRAPEPPPSIARTPEAAAPPPPAPSPRRSVAIQRPVEEVDMPRAELVGDPDAADLAVLDPTGRDSGRHPKEELAPPSVRILPPVKIQGPSRRGSRKRAAAADPEALAERGAWGQVLRLCATDPSDPSLLRYSVRAHAWADRRLDEAVDAADRREYDTALEAIETVLDQMAGEAEYVDAIRGLASIKTLLELRFLDPEGEVARAVRHATREELRGTRWARLFDA